MAFACFFLLHSLLLYAPVVYPEARFCNWNSTWNWAGKSYSILGSILFLTFYRKFELKDYFLTHKQDSGFVKKGMLVIVGILTTKILLAYFVIPKKEWDLETVLYQFSMPGIDEEIAYRGIMLGILMKVLKSKNAFFNGPVFVTAILFGLAHGFSLSNDYEILFAALPFLRTMIHGLIWGWITIKSGSIVLALVSHGFGNGVGNLVRMS